MKETKIDQIGTCLMSRLRQCDGNKLIFFHTRGIHNTIINPKIAKERIKILIEPRNVSKDDSNLINQIKLIYCQNEKKI